MKWWISKLIDCIASGSFAISAFLIATVTQSGLSGPNSASFLAESGVFPSPLLIEPPHSSLTDLLSVVSQPANGVLWALLGAVLLAVGLHLIGRLRAHDTDQHHMMLNIGLVLAAAWPWIIDDFAVFGLLVAAAASLLLVLNIPSRLTGTPMEGLGDLPIAFVAGWVLVASASSLGMYVHHRLGMSFERGILLGLFGAALLGAWGQLRMGSNVTFALALIWAMIGFAAAAAGASITISTACVLGIAALVVVLVRVTT